MRGAAHASCLKLIDQLRRAVSRQLLHPEQLSGLPITMTPAAVLRLEAALLE
jgi:hypothetical protein